MAGLTVYLGWFRLLETDKSGLAALRGLCNALDIDTHWAPERHILFLASPVRGRHVAVDCAACPADSPLLEAAGRLGAELKAAGAGVSLLTEWRSPERSRAADAASPDVLLTLHPEPGGTGVTALFSTAVPSRSRVLARLMAESVSAATGFPVQRVQFRWARGETGDTSPGRHTPAVELGIPEPLVHPAAGNRDATDALVQGLWEGIMRFFAPPDLCELIGRLGRQVAAAGLCQELAPLIGGEDSGDPEPAVLEPERAPDPLPARNAAAEVPAPASRSAGCAKPMTNPFRPPGSTRVYIFQMQPGGQPAFLAQDGPTREPGSALAGPRPHSLRPGSGGSGAPSRPGGTFPSRFGQSTPVGETVRKRSHWHQSGH